MINKKIIKNKYYYTYKNIILTAMSEQRIKNNGVYYEKHHIFPRSISPKIKNNRKNLVLLTAREHFLCHKLLTKFTIGSYREKMIHAIWHMCKTYKHRNNTKTVKITSTTYKHLKELARSTISKTNSGRKRTDAFKQKRREYMLTDLNPLRGHTYWNGRKHTKEELQKMSDATKGVNHYKFRGYYHTPLGKFASFGKEEKILFKTNPCTLRLWCSDENRIISKTAFIQNGFLQSFGESIIGQTFKEIGFWFEPIN